MVMFFIFKQKTAYEMHISDWSSDVCSSDLVFARHRQPVIGEPRRRALRHLIEPQQRIVGESGASRTGLEQILRTVRIAVRADAREVAPRIVAEARARRGGVLVQAGGGIAVGAVGGIGPRSEEPTSEL